MKPGDLVVTWHLGTPVTPHFGSSSIDNSNPCSYVDHSGTLGVIVGVVEDEACAVFDGRLGWFIQHSLQRID